MRPPARPLAAGVRLVPGRELAHPRVARAERADRPRGSARASAGRRGVVRDLPKRHERRDAAPRAGGEPAVEPARCQVEFDRVPADEDPRVADPRALEGRAREELRALLGDADRQRGRRGRRRQAAGERRARRRTGRRRTRRAGSGALRGSSSEIVLARVARAKPLTPCQVM